MSSRIEPGDRVVIHARDKIVWKADTSRVPQACTVEDGTPGEVMDYLSGHDEHSRDPQGGYWVLPDGYDGAVALMHDEVVKA